MGILNVTPDSFADGGRYRDAAHAVDVALALIDAGADLLDVGGESTRPGATPVAAEDERQRVLPVVAALARQARIPISIDTYKAEVAAAALDAGAVIVNDVSGLAGDPRMAAVVAARRAAFVLMHNRGRSEAMYARAAVRRGGARGRRPSSRRAWRWRRRPAWPASASSSTPASASPSAPRTACASWRGSTTPSSRRSTGRSCSAPPASRSCGSGSATAPPGEREWGTAAAVTACILAGAHIVRVHGVEAMSQVARVADSILAARTSLRRA